MIQTLGPLLIGSVVGWCLYFFMRLYRRFTPKLLLLSLFAISGGPVLSVLERESRNGALNFDIILWYFTGVALGFFLYAVYVGAVSVLHATGRIRSPRVTEDLRGCGAGFIAGALEDIERLMGFEDLVMRWHAKEIDDESIKLALGGLQFTRGDYQKFLALPSDQHEVPKTCIARFTKLRLYEHLKHE